MRVDSRSGNTTFLFGTVRISLRADSRAGNQTYLVGTVRIREIIPDAEAVLRHNSLLGAIFPLGHYWAKLEGCCSRYYLSLRIDSS